MRIESERNLKRLAELTARVGNDPLLTQASTGNSSIKLDGILWMKASGRWMANALRENLFIPLNLGDVQECLRRGLDPAQHFPGSSLETAMHAVLPHPVVLHVHSVNTIAWAVQQDAVKPLRSRLEGLHWQWIPYVASGFPLGRKIQLALSTHPETNVFILGNHGLVIAGEDGPQVEALLSDIEGRLHIDPRTAHLPDYEALAQVCSGSPWQLPDDPGVHALATDPGSRAILAQGLLYPCQTIFSGSCTADPFRAIPYRHYRAACNLDRPFLPIEGIGVAVNRSTPAAEIAMLSGLAHVVQRLNASAPLRYLTETEIAGLSGQVAYRYRELANMTQPRPALARLRIPLPSDWTRRITLKVDELHDWFLGG